MAVFLFTDRFFQGNRFLGDLLDLTDLFHGKIHSFGNFFYGRFTSQLLDQSALFADQTVDGLDHVHRNTDRSCLIGDCTCDRLTDPPCSICTELKTLGVVEFVDRFDQTEVTFLDQIEELHATSEITLCDRNYETKVCFDQLGLRILIAFEHALGEFLFLFCRKKRNVTDFF